VAGGRRSLDPAAFTILELLTVVAIIGILAGILIPTTSAARASANRARTRVQFSQWAAAMETFRQEYGRYPDFGTGAGAALVNAGAASDPAGAHPFHDELAGTRRNGAALEAGALSQNPRRLRFVSFAESDFVRARDVAAGRNAGSELNLLRDAFHSTSIAVIADANHDGVINALDAPAGFPGVAAAGGAFAIRPSIPDGIHAGVIFYSAPPGAADETDLITSWR
jgi:prepilin-type N-terminal cleavage/methylation domain-containing protein